MKESLGHLEVEFDTSGFVEAAGDYEIEYSVKLYLKHYKV